ncbi:GPI mannosyltransferase 2 [Blastocladiella britannica]|nr:GPI mannosyltransferase 2 [Blastocladiella britannica]
METTGKETREKEATNLMYRALGTAIAFRAGLYALALAAHLLSPQDFDPSGDMILQSASPIWRTLLVPLVRWDALHFMGIAVDGDYVQEHQTAFFPVLPAFINAIAHLLPSGIDLTARVAFAGIIFNQIVFLLALSALYQLVHATTKSHVRAYQSAILFAVQPASIFTMSINAEPLFAFLSFSGALAWEEGKDVEAGVYFAWASLARSNGMLNAGFFLYGMLFRRRSVARSIVGGLLVLAPIAAHQMYLTARFCPSNTIDDDHTMRRPWCPGRSSTVGSPYGYVQQRYWGSGVPFAYWTVAQLPNFAMAAPMLVRAVHVAFRELKHQMPPRPIPTTAKGMFQWMHQWLSGTQRPHAFGVPYAVQMLVLVGITVVAMHVQICLRVFSGYAAIFSVWPDTSSSSSSVAVMSKYDRWWLRYSIVWASVGAVLFGVFLPPA